MLLLVLAALRPLAVPDEGRYGEIGRWMLASGDWLAPRLNGIPFFHKPPYLYWLEAMSLAVFGIQPWAVRLVPALHAALMLWALYLAARAAGGQVLARRAALMLGTSLAFLIGGQYVNHDMLVAAWISVAIWCFALAFLHGERPHPALARWGFLACALGVLSKGLIGLLLPGLVLFVWLLWTRQFKKALRLPWASGLALFCAVAVPWFALAGQRFPGMLAYLFGTQQFGRYTSTAFNNAQPWWFFLPALALLLFPWVFFALYQAYVQIRRPLNATYFIAKPWLALCWIWIAAILGFFSIPNSKLIGYALPAVPPLALLAALGWQRLMGARRAGAPLLAALAALAVALALGTNVAAGRYSRQGGAQDIAAALACAATPQDTVYALGGFPYDLAFYVQTPRPFVVLEDWAPQRAMTGDNWRRELFEGAGFDTQASRVLQPPSVLAAASQRPGAWVVAPAGLAVQGFTPVARGRRWALHRSAPTADAAAQGSAAKGPAAAQHEGLPGCQQQRREQREQ